MALGLNYYDYVSHEFCQKSDEPSSVGLFSLNIEVIVILFIQSRAYENCLVLDNFSKSESWSFIKTMNETSRFIKRCISCMGEYSSKTWDDYKSNIGVSKRKIAVKIPEFINLKVQTPHIFRYFLLETLIFLLNYWEKF